MIARKAVVLAAGFGTRLRPLTCTIPKPLLPIWGEPVIGRIVSLLRGWGVTDIVVNCHYLHDQIEKWCAANGCRAIYEQEILGTGGVLNQLRDWIGNDNFLLVNSDIIVEGIDECPFNKRTLSSPFTDAGVIGNCLVSTEGPRTIECEMESHFVTCWKSPDAGWNGTYTYCGLSLLKPEILKYVEPTGFSSIVQAYERAIADGLFMRGIEPPGLRWTDAGTVQSYIDLNQTADENAFAFIPPLADAISAAAKNGKDDKLAEIQFLGTRGSDRTFFRKGNEIIILYDDSKRAENAKYAAEAYWLKERGIAVPEIYADLPERKALVMEFAGSSDLGSVATAKGGSILLSYAPVIEELAKFHALDASELDLEPPFDAKLYKWERDLFADYFFKPHFHKELPDDLRKELELVADKLADEPAVLVHRDFQSTNVIFKNGKFKFIDFQGMRLGAAAYDLASLLYDPYIDIPSDTRFALATLYAQKSGRKDITKILPFAAVQRLIQALGAYGRLASVGQPQFKKYITPALKNLCAAATQAGLDAVSRIGSTH